MPFVPASPAVPQIDAGELAQLERANLANIIARVKKGHTLNLEDKDVLAAYSEVPASPDEEPPPPARAKPCTPRQELFVQAILAGKGPREALRLAGYSQRSKPAVLSVRASGVLKSPAVQARLAQLRRKAVSRILLSLEARLGLLAVNAMLPSRTAAHRNAQARAIEVYTKIAGDGAPELPPDPSAAPGDHNNPRKIVINIFHHAPTRTPPRVVEYAPPASPPPDLTP